MNARSGQSPSTALQVASEVIDLSQKLRASVNKRSNSNDDDVDDDKPTSGESLLDKVMAVTNHGKKQGKEDSVSPLPRQSEPKIDDLKSLLGDLGISSHHTSFRASVGGKKTVVPHPVAEEKKPTTDDSSAGNGEEQDKGEAKQEQKEGKHETDHKKKKKSSKHRKVPGSAKNHDDDSEEKPDKNKEMDGSNNSQNHKDRVKKLRKAMGKASKTDFLEGSASSTSWNKLADNASIASITSTDVDLKDVKNPKPILGGGLEWSTVMQKVEEEVWDKKPAVPHGNNKAETMDEGKNTTTGTPADVAASIFFSPSTKAKKKMESGKLACSLLATDEIDEGSSSDLLGESDKHLNYLNMSANLANLNMSSTLIGLDLEGSGPNKKAQQKASHARYSIAAPGAAGKLGLGDLFDKTIGGSSSIGRQDAKLRMSDNSAPADLHSGRTRSNPGLRSSERTLPTSNRSSKSRCKSSKSPKPTTSPMGSGTTTGRRRKTSEFRSSQLSSLSPPPPLRGLSRGGEAMRSAVDFRNSEVSAPPDIMRRGENDDDEFDFGPQPAPRSMRESDFRHSASATLKGRRRPGESSMRCSNRERGRVRRSESAAGVESFGGGRASMVQSRRRAGSVEDRRRQFVATSQDGGGLGPPNLYRGTSDPIAPPTLSRGISAPVGGATSGVLLQDGSEQLEQQREMSLSLIERRQRRKDRKDSKCRSSALSSASVHDNAGLAPPTLSRGISEPIATRPLTLARGTSEPVGGGQMSQSLIDERGPRRSDSHNAGKGRSHNNLSPKGEAKSPTRFKRRDVTKLASDQLAQAVDKMPALGAFADEGSDDEPELLTNKKKANKKKTSKPKKQSQKKTLEKKLETKKGGPAKEEGSVAGWSILSASIVPSFTKAMGSTMVATGGGTTKSPKSNPDPMDDGSKRSEMDASARVSISHRRIQSEHTPVRARTRSTSIVGPQLMAKDDQSVDFY